MSNDIPDNKSLDVSAINDRLASLESLLIQMDQRLSKVEHDFYESQADEFLDSIQIPTPIDTTDHAGFFEVVSVDSKVTEANSVWSKHAWQLSVKNLSNETLDLEATIEYLDEDGFVVDDTTVYDLLLNPRESKVFRGYVLIDDSIIDSVCSVSSKVQLS